MILNTMSRTNGGLHMTTESSARVSALASSAASRASGDTPETCAIAVNAAKVLDTTRRAWANAAAEAPTEPKTPRAAKPKRIAPRRSRWPSLIAALHYWSPKPL
jgi:hypothetical protein